MAFGISRSAKRNRGQYEASNVSQGEEAKLVLENGSYIKQDGTYPTPPIVVAPIDVPVALFGLDEPARAAVGVGAFDANGALQVKRTGTASDPVLDFYYYESTTSSNAAGNTYAIMNSKHCPWLQKNLTLHSNGSANSNDPNYEHYQIKLSSTNLAPNTSSGKFYNHYITTQISETVRSNNHIRFYVTDCNINNNDVHNNNTFIALQVGLTLTGNESVCTTDNIVVSNSVTVNQSVVHGSDNRIKHNENDITGALDTIMKLKGKEYIKTKELYDENHNFVLNADGNPTVNVVEKVIETVVETELKDEEGNVVLDKEGNPVVKTDVKTDVTYVVTNGEGIKQELPKDQYTWEKGFIAQDVEAEIPELSKSVGKHIRDGKEVYGLNYTDILTTNVCATQELCELVKKLTLRVQELEAVIAPPELTRQ